MGVNVLDYLVPEDREKALSNMGKVLQGEILGGDEYTMLKKDGTLIPVIIHARPITRNGYNVGMRGFIINISKLKENEEKLRFLSCRDALTGLYNRYFFEQKMQELNKDYRSAVLVLCDVDGLKVINDTLGHRAGDKVLMTTAGMIAGSFRREDVVARIGGDEFAVLLIDTDLPEAEEGINKLNQAVTDYNLNLAQGKFPLSISTGMAYTYCTAGTVWDLFKEADNNMYRKKLYHSQSTRSAIVQTLLKALEARDFITEGHADRLSCFVTALARNLNLPDSKVTDLCLLAHFHDIGKVGIPDRILFKKGTFTPEEYSEMQRHSEIGYRIAQSSPDLAPISDWILKHHEWWNGKGYPLGLREKEIPLECRILAIADAYDAMTNDRPYRKAKSHEEAIEELKQCAGKQFDPELVEKFVGLLSSPAAS